jgi:hypothetical protein
MKIWYLFHGEFFGTQLICIYTSTENKKLLYYFICIYKSQLIEFILYIFCLSFISYMKQRVLCTVYTLIHFILFLVTDINSYIFF